MKNIIITAVMFATLVFTGCAQKEVVVEENQLPETETYVNAIDFIDELALHDAVRAKDMEQVKILIAHKSEVNFQDKYGYTPLHIAVRLNQYEMSEFLIKNGADVNTIDNYKDTPLLDSTRDDYTEISKLLICNGADRQVSDRYDMTPLHNSAKNKNKLISEMLLARDITPFCQEQVEQPVEDIVEPVEPESIEEVSTPVEESVEEVTTLAESPEFEGLYEALMEEFKDDFEPWNAELTKDDLMFRFNNPSVLFEKGSDTLKLGFINILNDFFPRYLKVLSKYKDNIEEIRVEGHTSSEYSSAENDSQRYRLNKVLSQKRANAVRNFSVESVLFSKGSSELKESVSVILGESEINGSWVEGSFQPYGMSYDNLILNEDGSENAEASRRVDFKIMKK